MVSKGWPPDVALNMSDEHQFAFLIMGGVREGGSFNWQQFKFEKPKKE